MSLSDGNLCCYKERGCYPGWGFSGGTPGSSGRLSRSARSQNAPRIIGIISHIGRNLKVPYARRQTASGAALQVVNPQSSIAHLQFAAARTHPARRDGPVPMHRGPVPTFFVGMRHPRYSFGT
jgi:hypothetical protein